ncbi:MAG TPA: GNAT family N-acetyltransferase, partial [Longimicrobium sp.]
YSVVESFQRRGYATEAALGLTAYAFAEPAVTRVVAETLPHLDASIGVLHKLGFGPADDPSSPEVIRFERHR